MGEGGDALQYILTKILGKRFNGKFERVWVDSRNYRTRREKSLRTMALSLSEKVKRTGRSVSTKPLPPRERRVIHLVLKEDHKVRTLSRGEGELRRVVILPAEQSD